MIDVCHAMKSANKMPIKIDGAIVLKLSGKDQYNQKYNCTVMVFISPDIDDFFLSEDAMKDLAIIPRDFPQIGAARELTH